MSHLDGSNVALYLCPNCAAPLGDVCLCRTEGNRRPNFGEWFTGVYASEQNPQRHGMYVRTIRRSGRVMNPGAFYELTDGKGQFWQYPVGSVVRKDPKDETNA